MKVNVLNNLNGKIKSSDIIHGKNQVGKTMDIIINELNAKGKKFVLYKTDTQTIPQNTNSEINWTNSYGDTEYFRRNGNSIEIVSEYIKTVIVSVSVRVFLSDNNKSFYNYISRVRNGVLTDIQNSTMYHTGILKNSAIIDVQRGDLIKTSTYLENTQGDINGHSEPWCSVQIASI